jgi:DNA-directed RNA polymerase specialized sigma24 family protein
MNEPVSREPDPQFAAQMAEEYQRLLARLGDDRLRQIAILAMEGYKSVEIAKQFACGLRTVERKLERIRAIWKTEMSL